MRFFGPANWWRAGPLLRHWLTPNDCRRCEPCDGESEISPQAVISNPSIAWSSQRAEW